MLKKKREKEITADLIMICFEEFVFDWLRKIKKLFHRFPPVWGDIKEGVSGNSVSKEGCELKQRWIQRDVRVSVG